MSLYPLKHMLQPQLELYDPSNFRLQKETLVHVHIGFIEKQRSGGRIVIYMLDYQSRGQRFDPQVLWSWMRL